MGRSGCYFRLCCSTLGVRCWMFGVRIHSFDVRCCGLEETKNGSAHGRSFRTTTVTSSLPTMRHPRQVTREGLGAAQATQRFALLAPHLRISMTL